MKTSIRSLASLSFAAALILTGCASGSDSRVDASDTSEETSSQAEAAPEETSAGSMSGPSDFAPCPVGVTEGMDSISSTSWHDLDISEVVLPEGVVFPVPSCAISNPDGTWILLMYIGADPALFDELGAQLVTNGFTADPGASEGSPVYKDSEGRTLVNFEYAAEVSPASFKSQFLGAPHVAVSLMY